MPQIQSQKKRVKTNNKRNLAVSAQKSALRTSIKKVLAAVDAKAVAYTHLDVYKRQVHDSAHVPAGSPDRRSLL